MPWEPGANIRNMIPYTPTQGDYQIRLDANESGYHLPSSLREEIARSVAGLDLNRYPDPYARELCTDFANRYGVNADHVTAGNGSDELISLVIGSTLQPSDKVVSLDPDFTMYRFYADLFQRPHLIIQKGDSLQVDVDDLIRTVKEQKAAALILSNPCNPTGQLIPREEVLRLVTEVDALVVLDEAYMDFADQSVLDVAADYPNLIVLRTCSKAVGLAAIRLGFAVANPAITRVLQAVKSPYNVNAMTQAVGRCLLAHGDYLASRVQSIVEQRNWVQEQLAGLSRQFPAIDTVYPSSTNFVLLRTPKAEGIYKALCSRSILVRCLGNYLRITVGTPEENTALVAALTEILEGGV